MVFPEHEPIPQLSQSPARHPVAGAIVLPFFAALERITFISATKAAKTKNAPGANTKIVIGVYQAFFVAASARGRIWNPKICPAPRISRTIPIVVSPSVNPSPIPSPSKIEGITGFFEA